MGDIPSRGIPEVDEAVSGRKKPKCKLIGEDGNVFNLIAIAQRVLKKNGMRKEAEEVWTRINNEAEDYDHALRIIMEYVDVY